MTQTSHGDMRYTYTSKDANAFSSTQLKRTLSIASNEHTLGRKSRMLLKLSRLIRQAGERGKKEMIIIEMHHHQHIIICVVITITTTTIILTTTSIIIFLYSLIPLCNLKQVMIEAYSIQSILALFAYIFHLDCLI